MAREKLEIEKKSSIDMRHFARNHPLLVRLFPQFLLVISLLFYLFLGAFVFRILDEELANISFADVIFFEFITLTTIGYGNVSPKTESARVFTILYCLVGIPLTIVTIANLGKFVTKAYWQLLMFCGSKSARSRIVNDANMPLFVVLFLFFVTFLVGSLIVDHNGNEHLVDDFYFGFISFTTVGFGDRVPHFQSNWRLLLTIFYIIWGCMLTTSLFSILNKYFSEVHYLGRRFRGARDANVWMGGQSMTVSKLISAVAQQFEANPREIRTMLQDLDFLIESCVDNKEHQAPIAQEEDFEEEII